MHGHLDKDIQTLQDKLLGMAALAERAVREAIRAFNERDPALAIAVRDQDQLLDKAEIDVDNMAVQILAEAPLARDLRFVVAAMKISQNLERIGDEAAKIAKRARDLSKEPPINIELELPRIVELVTKMLRDALDSFVKRDPQLARSVLPTDQEVDTIHKQIRQRLIMHMKSNPNDIPQCLDILTATKCLERIADHATNIAEDVVYMCEATDIRHQPKSTRI